VGHVTGSVIEVAALQAVVIAGNDAQIFRSAFGYSLGEQVAPGVIPVIVTPEFGFAAEYCLGAIGACVLR